MKLQRSCRLCALAAAIILVNIPVHAHACAVCMGDPNSSTAGALNASIFLMLGFIGAMLASFAAFAIYLFRRSSLALEFSDHRPEILSTASAHPEI